ncbi:MAG: zf-TFIIB domain-containing protein [Thermoplasmata archaeon]
MNCPRDNSFLQKDFHSAIMIDVCPQCAGMFISLNELVNHFSVPDLEKLLREKVDESPSSPFRCPRCDVLKTLANKIDSTMHPFIVKNIEIDICGNCLGIWFDGGELEKIMPQTEYQKLMDYKRSSSKNGDTEQTSKLLEEAREKEMDVLSSIAEAKPRCEPRKDTKEVKDAEKNQEVKVQEVKDTGNVKDVKEGKGIKELSEHAKEKELVPDKVSRREEEDKKKKPIKKKTTLKKTSE